MIPVESESAPEYLNRKNVIYWRDSMRTIAPFMYDVKDPQDFKRLEKDWKKQNKWLEKMLRKAMFTRWERFCLWFWRIKI